MKIAVAPADAFGCGFIRMMVPYKALRAKGYDIEFVDNPTSPAIVQADVLVLQRQSSEQVLELARYLQRIGKKIVFEFDDNFHAVPASNPSQKAYSNGKPETKALETFIREADLVTVSTPDLAREYRKFNDHIRVCYNALPDEQFERFAGRELPVAPRRENQIRIGWAGSDTHRADLRSILKPLVKVMDTVPWARLVFIGADMRAMLPAHLWPRTEFAGSTFGHPDFRLGDESDPTLSPVAYFDLIDSADLDVAIAPLEPTTFNRCKSYIKLLEYGMLGIPALASNFGPYRQYASFANSVLTADPEGWENRLRMLCVNPVERVKYAHANREQVRAAHLISFRVHEWESALDSLKETTCANAS